jgi:TonB-linked SusC/RagA family outer membrane protein
MDMTKKVLFILCFVILCVKISVAQENTLTLHLKKVGLGRVFDDIQRQSEYIIFFKDNQVDLNRKVSIDAESLPVEEILDKILEGTGLNYKVFDRQIIIVRNKESATTLDSQMQKNQTKRRTITGRVVDEVGMPVLGVTVVVKDTHIGVVTDPDGNYTLDVPVDASALVFSFVGMKSMEESLRNRSLLNVTMYSDNLDVEEVVVSALGLRRAEKALSYATQTIREDEISRNKDLNFINGISGKISGLEISKSAAGAGGSTKIILRGNKSLSETSEPLFVIDGIPMVNKKGGQLGMFGGSDSGDGLSQINTDDIESMTILKGANAAVLYGSQGANGVILITTKKVKKGEVQGSYSSSFLLETVMSRPQLQFEYGGVNGSAESWSYEKGKYPSSYVDDFFRTGTTLVNTLTLGGGNDKSSSYFSFSNTSIGGIMPRNQYGKYNITYKQSIKFFDDKLTVTSNVMMIQERTKNKNTAGYYLNPLTGLYMFPRDKDYSYYASNYQLFDATRNMYLQNWHVSDHFQSNPEWIINNEPREDLTKRLISNLAAEYKLSEHLVAQFRGNYDYAIKTNEKRNKAGSNATNVHPNGSWDYQKYTDELIYGDALLTYSNNFDGLSVDALLGTSYQKSTYGLGISVSTGLDGLKYPNEFSFQNIADNVQVNSTLDSRIIKEGVFGNLQLGYREKVYVDLSGRNDWASSLWGTGNDSYFYPSFGLTGILSNLMKMPSFVTFGKLRSSYTIVGNEVPFNKVEQNNTITTSGVLYNTTKPFTNLRPEMIHSFEFGGDWRFFDGFWGIDFTLYNIKSKDQFISLPAPSGSGYTDYFVNAGKIVNSGVEISINNNLIRRSNFKWISSINFATNRNKIVKLHPDLKEPISLSDNEGYQLLIKEGGSFGDLYVHKFLRDGKGRIVLDANGDILKTSNREYIGNSNPKLSLGFNNTLKFKNLSLGVLINGKFGGRVISQTEAMLDGYGVSKRTAIARENGGVEINAVMPDGTEVHKMDARAYYSAIGNRDGIKEPYTYYRTNLRLAQLILSYDFTLRKIGINSASLSFTGQNLFFIYKDAPFDPEITLNTLISDQALDNFSIPSTRTFGLNFKINF